MRHSRFVLLCCCSLLCPALLFGAEPSLLVSRLNILRNGDVESGDKAPAYWQSGTGLKADVSFAWSTTAVHSGRRSLEIDCRDPRAPQWAWWNQQLEGQAAGRYVVSGYYRANRLDGAVQIGLHSYAADQHRIAVQPVLNSSSPTHGWIHFEASVDVPAAAVRTVFTLGCRGDTHVWFDDLSVARVVAPQVLSLASTHYVQSVSVTDPALFSVNAAPQTSAPGIVLAAPQTYSAAPQVVEEAAAVGDVKDLSGRFWVGNDAQHLYLYGDVLDNRFPVVRHPYWQGDSIQLVIDTNNDKHADDFDADDFAVGFVPGAETAQIVPDHVPAGASMAGIRATFRVVPGGYRFAAVLPVESLGVKSWHPGQSIGFDILLNDSDGAGRKWTEWTPGIATSKDPSQYGTVILSNPATAGAVFARPATHDFDDTEAAIVEVDTIVSTAVPNARLEGTLTQGNTSHPFARSFPLQPGVNRLDLMFAPERLSAGDWTANISVTGTPVPLATATAFHVVPLRQGIVQINALAADVERKAAAFATQIDRCKAAGQDVTTPLATLTIARLFARYARYDANMRDFQEQALKSLRYVDGMLDRGAAQAAAVLAGKSNYPRIPHWDVTRLAIHDGGFWSANQPVFLTGFCTADAMDLVDDLKALGMNIADTSMGPGWTMSSMTTFKDDWIDGRIRPLFQLAEQRNFAVDCLFGHGINGLKWLLKEHPDFTGAPGHFCDYDIDHPAARELWAGFLDHYTPILARGKALLSYDLLNEASFPLASKYTIAKWRVWLQQKYGSIAAVNRTWGTKFASFDAVKNYPDGPDDGRAEYYDWCIFNQYRVTDFFQFLIDAIRKHDPHVATHVKFGSEQTFMGSSNVQGREITVSSHKDGIDRQALARICGIHGCDTRPVYKNFFGSQSYAFEWMGSAMSFDLMKSLAPDKPIYDSEWHSVDTVFYRKRDIPADHMRLALWMTHLHGLDANLIWWWSRQPDGSHKRQWFDASLLEEPWLLDAYVQTSFELRRFVPQVMAFTQAPRPVRLLYSEASAIQDVHYLDQIRHAYEALNFLGASIGFVTEEQLAKGIPAGTKLIIVPNAGYVEDTTVTALRAAVKDGVTVGMLGDANLGHDPYGHARTDHTVAGALSVPLAGAKEYHEPFNSWIGKSGIERDLIVTAEGRTPVWGVETRTARNGQQRVAYMANLLNAPVTVHLQWTAGDVQPKNLLTGQPVPAQLTLQPRDVVLMEY